jgi:hypothetical protein
MAPKKRMGGDYIFSSEVYGQHIDTPGDTPSLSNYTQNDPATTDGQVISTPQIGGGTKVKYNSRQYIVRIENRRKFILVKGKQTWLADIKSQYKKV